MLVNSCGEVAAHTVVIAKYVWFFAVLSAVCGIGYHLSTLVERFLDRPIQEVTTTLNTPIPFPGITVCNLDRISRSNYDDLLLTVPEPIEHLVNKRPSEEGSSPVDIVTVQEPMSV